MSDISLLPIPGADKYLAGYPVRIGDFSGFAELQTSGRVSTLNNTATALGAEEDDEDAIMALMQ